MHEHLSLVIGFETVPDDTASAELPLQVLTLVGGVGFALEPEDGWQPQQPALKNGGVWAESSTSLGRILIAGEDGNVTETMRLVLGTGDPKTLYTYVVALNRFIETARRHWTTYYQTLPTYLKWKAICGAGYQYALVYNIDAAVDYGRQANGLAEATLSIEREPYWRAIPPGSNPKRYYYEKNNLVWKKDNADLGSSGTDHFKVEALENRQEWNAALSSAISNNYMDISNIPGDAPALLCLSVRSDADVNYSVQKIFISRSTKNTPLNSTRVAGANILYSRYILLNMPDGTPVTDTTRAADTGGPKYSITGANSRMEVSFATTTTLAARVNLQNTSTIDWSILRGKFAVLMRMRQAGGTFGQIIVQVNFVTGDSGANATLSVRGNPTVVAGVGNTSGWPLVYLGDITIPIASRDIVSAQGYGEAVGTESGGFIQILASRSAGAGVLYLADMILLPIDEGAFSIEGVNFNTAGSTTPGIVDGTGYLSRGAEESIGLLYSGTPPRQVIDNLEIKGDVFTLIPNVTNRIYFLTIGTRSSVADRSELNHSITVMADIVPRWRGVRDV